MRNKEFLIKKQAKELLEFGGNPKASILMALN